ncbi:hypothetical protein PILCRDRAFT_3614 [Piloderma croceum F 1598]|uniref:Uncharacterized protein n=1 Tax=Piloderma croceum (strain F 1598) TaxID=765440 RepID=A0A0C3FU46_PILCF|nr:hypothetical protein PILCRDRAFT_3614 [Piloderma croceum F 1598]
MVHRDLPPVSQHAELSTLLFTDPSVSTTQTNMKTTPSLFTQPMNSWSSDPNLWPTYRSPPSQSTPPLLGVDSSLDSSSYWHPSSQNVSNLPDFVDGPSSSDASASQDATTELNPLQFEFNPRKTPPSSFASSHMHFPSQITAVATERERTYHVPWLPS